MKRIKVLEIFNIKDNEKAKEAFNIKFKPFLKSFSQSIFPWEKVKHSVFSQYTKQFKDI